MTDFDVFSSLGNASGKMNRASDSRSNKSCLRYWLSARVIARNARKSSRSSEISDSLLWPGLLTVPVLVSSESETCGRPRVHGQETLPQLGAIDSVLDFLRRF